MNILTLLPRPDFAAWRAAGAELTRELFEQDGLSTVFGHARNVLSGTVIIAAGLFAVHHKAAHTVPGTWALHGAGYIVAAVGVLLLVLNLFDGLRRLARRQRPLALRVVVSLLYVALSLRLIQVFVYFRGGAF